MFRLLDFTSSLDRAVYTFLMAINNIASGKTIKAIQNSTTKMVVKAIKIANPRQDQIIIFFFLIYQKSFPCFRSSIRFHDATSKKN